VVILFLLFDGAMKLFRVSVAVEGPVQLGYRARVACEICSGLAYGRAHHEGRTEVKRPHLQAGRVVESALIVT
jgi:hypothetical protein